MYRKETEGTGALVLEVRVSVHKLRLHQIGPGVDGPIVDPAARRDPSHLGQPL